MTTGKSLDKLTEDELLARARKAMSRAASLPVGSLGRSVQWGAFDTVMAELDRRAVRFFLAKTGRTSGK
jgi:hypothetical protein